MNLQPSTTSFQFSSVTQSCLTLCNPKDCSMPGFPVHHQFQSLLKLMSLELVMPSNHCILCRPLLFLPCQGAMGPNLGLVTLLKEKSNQKEAEEKMNGW